VVEEDDGVVVVVLLVVVELREDVVVVVVLDEVLVDEVVRVDELLGRIEVTILALPVLEEMMKVQTPLLGQQCHGATSPAVS
jgi:hypothetical protein